LNFKKKYFKEAHNVLLSVLEHKPEWIKFSEIKTWLSVNDPVGQVLADASTVNDSITAKKMTM